MIDTEIFHVYNEDDIIEHDTESLDCICSPYPIIGHFTEDEDQESKIFICHQFVAAELKEKESFMKRFFKGFFLLW